MKKHTFKVQLPQESTEDEPQALVYNEDRSVEQLLPITDELKKAVGKKAKAYFEGTYTKPGEPDEGIAIDFAKRVTGQRW